ncbi:MAG: hypothetical protein ACT4N4_08950 [Rhodospirillales bacterium]
MTAHVTKPRLLLAALLGLAAFSSLAAADAAAQQTIRFVGQIDATGLSAEVTAASVLCTGSAQSQEPGRVLPRIPNTSSNFIAAVPGADGFKQVQGRVELSFVIPQGFRLAHYDCFLRLHFGQRQENAAFGENCDICATRDSRFVVRGGPVP